MFDPLTIPLATSLLEASAGTGKTFTITILVLRLLLERQLPINRILVVTFTKAATRELRARIRERLQQALVQFQQDPSKSTFADPSDPVERLAARSQDRPGDARRLAEALRNFDQAPIFTIHSFCQHCLQRFGQGDSATLLENNDAWLEDIIADYWSRELSEASPLFVRYLLDQNVTPTSLRTLVARRRLGQDTVVVSAPEHVIAAKPLTQFVEAWKKAKHLWKQQQQEIRATLNASGLNKVKYSASSQAKWLTWLDELFAPGEPTSVQFFEQFEKFTNPVLRESTKKGSSPPVHPFFDACDLLLASTGEATTDLQTQLAQWKQGFLHYALRELARYRREQGTMTFDDLLTDFDALLRTREGTQIVSRLREAYPVALIDEFQDTDPIQYRIFDTVYAPTTPNSTLLFLIGDPKQAIYSFRGADIFSYLQAAKNEGAIHHTLQTNYRSSPRLVQSINTIFSQAERPFLLDAIRFEHVAAATTHVVCGADGRELAPFHALLVPRPAHATAPLTKAWMKRHLPAQVASFVVQQLNAGLLLDGKPLAPADIAILVRKNSEAFAMQTAVEALGVAVTVSGDADVFETMEAQHLEWFLGALVAPDDRSALRLALCSRLLGLSADDLWQLDHDERAYSEHQQNFLTWQALLHKQGLLFVVRYVLEQPKILSRLVANPGGVRSVTHFIHIAELLNQVGSAQGLSPEGLLRWLRRARSDERVRLGLGRDALRQRCTYDESAVNVVTIHQSKGLEYPVVLCPYLWDSGTGSSRQQSQDAIGFHDPHEQYQYKVDFGSPNFETHRAWAEQENEGENRRLLYVALTRAKAICYVVWGGCKGLAGSPLAPFFHPRAVQAADAAAGDEATPLDSWTDDELRADLQRFSLLAPGCFDVTDLPLASLTPWSLAVCAARSGHAAPAVGYVPTGRSWRVGSFTSLTAASNYDDTAGERWHDEGEDEPALLREPSVTLPRGARLGRLLHDVLETMEFSSCKTPPGQALLRAQLSRHGFADSLQQPVEDLLYGALTTPLVSPTRADDAFQLIEVPKTSCRCELEFYVPVGHGAVSQPLTPDGLADTFKRYASLPLPVSYVEQLRRLDFAALEGYLHGVIDLVFERDGRWYLIDYKSNDLGSSPFDYSPARLVGAMAEHHYFLQYHLYLVALHRYLQRTVTHYRYEKNMGGVFYLFLRGMTASDGHGVFSDLPSVVLIEALSKRLGKQR